MPSSRHARKRRPRSRGPASGIARATGASGPGEARAAFLSGWLTIALLTAVTLMAYANAWPDTLTFDDRVFVDRARFAALGLTDFPRFFTEDLWAASGVESGLYRPLLMVSIAVQARLFGDWLAGYHLVSVFLHVLATLLVFRLICHLLETVGHPAALVRPAALLAAMVFGIHPIHAEAVNSVFNGSELLVCIGIAGGLRWFLERLEHQPVRAWVGLNGVFLLVLLCRESGASLPALTVALIWLTRPEPWLARLRACLPALTMLVPLAVYLALRGHALEPPGDPATGGLAGTTQVLRSVADSSRHGVSFSPDRLVPAAVLWFESLQIMLWPHPLQVYYDKPDTNAWLAVAAQLALLATALVLHARNRSGLIIALAFFYLAYLPSSQIFGTARAAPGLADRVLYLPSVGMAILLAVGLGVLARRFGLRVAIAAVIVVSVVLTPLTWARNAQWASDTELFESDYLRLENRRAILNTLLAAHLREGNTRRAVAICDAEAAGLKGRASWGVHCGSAYGQVGRFGDAEQAYLAATRRSDSRVFARVNLAIMYLHLDRRSEARAQFEQAIAAEEVPFLREFFSGLMLIRMYPNDRARLLEARAHLARALELQPQHADSREELRELDARLGLPGE